MKIITLSKIVILKRVFTAIIVAFSLSLIAGCGVGLEKGPAYRTEYSGYPSALVRADQALDEARKAGKDKVSLRRTGSPKSAMVRRIRQCTSLHLKRFIQKQQEQI